MIFIDRQAVQPPLQLREFHERTLKEFGEIYKLGDVSRVQRRPDFQMPSSLTGEVRERLGLLFHRNCAYCERAARNIDHFRPKWRASRLDRRIDPEHYWWLYGDWRNLYLACHDCNSRKANAFPIDGPPAAPLTFGRDLDNELPLLVDPCVDRPEEHLSFGLNGVVVPRTRKGEVTIQLFELNNPYLVKARAASAAMAVRECELMWDLNPVSRDELTFRQRIESTVSGMNHIAVVRVAIDNFITDRFNLAPVQAEPFIRPESAEVLPKTVWLDRIEISNFKSITKLDLQFPRQDEGASEPSPEDEAKEQAGEMVGQPWLMMLGENGVGKSSLLQAIALALMPDVERDKQGRPSSWLRRQEGVQIKSGYVRLTFSDGAQRELGFKKGVAQFAVTGELPTMAVLAYGSTRLLPRGTRKKDQPARVSVRNLFDNRHPLSSTERYLCDIEALPEKQFHILAGSLKSLLPITEETELKRDGARLSARIDGRTVNLDQLSDGYKSMLALAMDIMFHLTDSTYDMESASGLVMIDELELHLHPRWKVAIVQQLRTLFPNVRFIVSTHDPLCVLGLRSSELHILTVDNQSRGVQTEQIDVPKGTRADEVLTGPWFGVASTIDAETQILMDEHSKLIVRTQLRPGDEDRRNDIEALLSHRLAGYATTRAQRAMLAAAAVLNPSRSESHRDQVLRHRLSSLLDIQAAEPGGAANA